MTKNDFWDLAEKPQTKIKLRILRDYLRAWVTIFTKQKWCKSLYYVDCCAGRGKYHNGDQKDIIDGSPLIALSIAEELKAKNNFELTCIFVEQEPATFKELEKICSPFKSKVGFHVIQGSINSKIEEILTLIPKEAPIFFFIDPEGISIHRETIEKILQKQNIKEFLITYIQKGIERCLGFGKKDVKNLPIDIQKRAISNLKKIEDFFGTDWEKLSKDQKENLKNYLGIFSEYNETVEEKDKLESRIIDIFYNRGRNKYYLIFISRNKNALKIIEDVFTTIKLDGTLFNALSYKEKRKMLQGTFEI